MSGLLFGALTVMAREGMEWCHINSFDANRSDLPRVLLIGDSITMRYSGAVRNALKGKAYVTVLGTSKALGDSALFDEMTAALKQYKYAVVHFNNGLHGFKPEAFRKGLPEMIATIRKHAPDAKLIWGTVTPCRSEGTTTRVQKANEIAAEIVAKENIPVDDLYGLVMENKDKPELLWDGGGVHFTQAGADSQGKHVAAEILKLLPE